MSWSAIRSALATRVDSVSGVDKIHESEPYELQGIDRDSFQSKFGTVVNGKFLLNYWSISRPNVTNTLCPDRNGIKKRTHSVEIRGTQTLETSAGSESAMQTIADEIMNALMNGDRTLGGVAVTHNDPSQRLQNVTFYGSIVAHEATISLQIEENIGGS